MFSFRLISSSVRGASTLASNQLTTGFIVPKFELQLTNYRQPNRRLQNVRTVTTSEAHLFQAAKIPRIQDIDIAKLEFDIDLPPKPKKPITPWLAFVRERKDRVLSQKDKMTAAELSVILSKEWKNIDKTPYENDFKERQREYQLQVQKYNDSLTNEHRSYLNVQSQIKRDDKATKLIRKTKPPTMPRNAANFYCHERSKQDDIKEQLKTRKSAHVFKDIFKEYRELSESEKQKYLSMQENDKLRFQHEFNQWYEGIQKNDKLTKVALEKAEKLRDRYKHLHYI